MGARISKRSGSYNFKKEEEKQQRLVSNNLRRSYSVVSLSEAIIYGDYAVTAALSREHSLIGELRKRQSQIAVAHKEVSLSPHGKDSHDETVKDIETSKIINEKSKKKAVTFRKPSQEIWTTCDKPGRLNVDEQVFVEEPREEQREIKEDEQVPIEDDENLISDIKKASTGVINNLTNIQKQLIPIVKEYLQVQTNQSKEEITSKINGECNKSEVKSNQKEEQIEVPQVNGNCNGDRIIPLNLESNNSLEKGQLQTPNEIYRHRRTKTISGNSELSYKSIDNVHVDVESSASDSDSFYSVDDAKSDGQLEVCEEERRKDKLIMQKVTSKIIECVNEQSKNRDFEKINPGELLSGSIDEAQIEVPDEIKPTNEVNEDEREEEGSLSSLESMESLEEPDNLETISNFSVESKNSIIVVENSVIETKEGVKVEKIDDDTLHEINIKFQITDKLSQVENEKNEIEIGNYLAIERVSENQLDERTAETASVSNEITKVMQENNENLNLEETTTEEIIECVNEQTKNRDFEKINPGELLSGSIDDAQIEVPDEIKPTDEVNEDEREEEGSLSSLESMESLEEPDNLETISNFSVESKNSIIVVENSVTETKEGVKVEKVDDDTLHEIDIKFQITDKLSQVENKKNEIEIGNYLPIERVSENQLDESTAETASVSNEITKVMQENNENLNLEKTTTENTNKSIDESFSNHTLHRSSNIIDSRDILLNNSEVKNVPLSVVAVNFENSDQVELPLNNNIDKELEIIISKINTVIEEINYLNEQIDNLTSKMHEEHNISEMYQTLIKLMRNVNAIKYSKFDEKVINLQHVALDKIHYCLNKLKSVEVTKE